jgi:hypothetical protein
MATQQRRNAACRIVWRGMLAGLLVAPTAARAQTGLTQTGLTQAGRVFHVAVLEWQPQARAGEVIA